MLTSMRLQGLRHDLATEKQQQHLFEIEFSSFLDIYLRVGLLDRIQ